MRPPFLFMNPHDTEEGLDCPKSMEGETTLGELSDILREVGCDAIPSRLHQLTLADLERWFDDRL